MKRALLPAWLLSLALLAAWGGQALAADAPRSLPFNKQNVYNYFKQVADEKRSFPEEISGKEYEERTCLLFATTLKKSGYDFEATVQNAVQGAQKGNDRMTDPRFLFLAGVFQAHPDVFLRLKLISKATRDAVVAYFNS
ncbi:MAG: hypothetical protein AAGU21_13155 [Solidesulfovibrio sp.]|uniref:hypothetical protein n=1 Tax=Solidesulfovibrio sp. TaxID=2910990 RepID=UPI002B1F0B23|nr:hypothetical protein [Solidesulfovibrio sp.]MEA4855104.1 hypothetical protein [Solidesulfovibrio sp.]